MVFLAKSIFFPNSQLGNFAVKRLKCFQILLKKCSYKSDLVYVINP